AVDASGNVCISGRSYGDGTQYDYATICFRPNGDTAWLERYLVPGIGWDIAQDIAFDNEGNAIVTGYSWGESNPYDWATVKYDPNGVELWQRRFGGAAGNEDWAYALALDSSGAVYVTGTSNGYRPDTTEFDIVTYKYRANGDSAWVKMLDLGATDAAFAIALDPRGAVYVTGITQDTVTGLDFITVKYRPDGETAWTRRFDGPAHSRDQAVALALDQHANVYVIGTSTPAPGADGDWTLVKYDSAGNLVWVRYYQGPSTDQPTALATDPAGNVIVTGYTSQSGQSWDWLTIKYRPSGDTVWTRRHNGPGSGPDLANALVLDQHGNAIVTGSEYSDSGYSNIRTACYDTSGTEIWSATWSGPGQSDDEAVAVAIDRSGAVYVAGYTGTVLSGNDYVLIKYLVEPGVAEPTNPAQMPASAGATIVRGALHLAGREQSGPALLDASGRRVMKLDPGANDLGQLAPGVYFVLTATSPRSSPRVNRIVVTK
ncbi:MAG: SBBP repeat-containing protein, partial [candidate division WOR-3 bacterium]